MAYLKKVIEYEQCHVNVLAKTPASQNLYAHYFWVEAKLSLFCSKECFLSIVKRPSLATDAQP